MSKVLIIEDDKIISKMYNLKFKNAGYDVELAENGADGLAKMKSFHPDIVLMDLMMPHMDGFTAITEAQKDETLKKIPIIVLTNLSTTDDADKAIAMGAKQYIVKSNVTPAQVVEKVKEFLASKSS